MARIIRFTGRAFAHFAGVLGLMGRETEAVLYRFPITVPASIAVSVICVVGINRAGDSYRETVTPFVFALVILGLFAAAFRVFCDEIRARNRVYAAGNAVILVAAALYAVYLRHALPDKTAVESIRFAVLVVAGSSAVFCAPFMRGARALAANWAVAVGLRFAVSWSYAMIMYAGIALALSIIDALLGIDVSGDVYLAMFILFSGIFMPVHFLSGVPVRARDCGEIRYPRPLMILITYIVLPLIGIYLAIIYVYFAKAIVTRSWPEGTAAYLILVFSIAGVLLLFAVSPIERLRKDWVSRYTAYFYRTLIPLLPLLFIAIGKRVYEYGITEKRYFVVLLAVWLAGMTLYWVVSKTRAHIVIPMSVFLCALLSVFGPWSAFNVSRVSQAWRLEKLLSEAGILKNGAIVNDRAKLEWREQFEIIDTIRYLRNTHGGDSMPFLPARIRSSEPEAISAALGLFSGEAPSGNRTFEYYLSARDGKIVDLRSCRYFGEFDSRWDKGDFPLGDGTVVRLDSVEKKLVVSRQGHDSVFDLSRIVTSLPAVGKYKDAYNGNCGIDEMMWRGKYKGGDIRILFTTIQREGSGKSFRVNSARFYLFVSPGK